MSKQSDYEQRLSSMEDWDDFLLVESNLPSPRANLELLFAAAKVADENRLLAYLDLNNHASVNDPRIFPLLVAVTGLGKLISRGKPNFFDELANYANDGRWRVREAVAFAIQTVGDQSMDLLIETMNDWSTGSFLQQRAVVAGLCEPRLLKNEKHAEAVLAMLRRITLKLSTSNDRQGEAFKALRQTLGYGISVAAVALPAKGRQLIEELSLNDDKDIKFIVRENLKKNRLIKMDPEWTSKMINATLSNQASRKPASPRS